MFRNKKIDQKRMAINWFLLNNRFNGPFGY